MYSLLIVDDEPMALNFIRFVINKYNLPFEICAEGEDGEQAIELADLHKPDFIIIDVDMPLLDGLTAAKIIKTKYPETQIYILTAYEYFEYAQRAVKIRVEDYLLKPLKAETLVEALQNGIMLLTKERTKKGEISSIREQVEQLKPIVKEKMLDDLKKENFDISKFDIILPNIQTKSFKPVGVISVSLLHTGVNQSYLLDAFIDRLKQKCGIGLYSILANGQLILFINEFNRSTIEETVYSWSKILKLQLAVGIAPITKEESIHVAFNKAEEVRRTAVFWGYEGVFGYEDFKNLPYGLSEISRLQKNMYKKLLEKKFSEIEQAFKKQLFEENLVFYSQVMHFSKKIITVLSGNLSELFPDLDCNGFILECEKRLETTETVYQLEETFLSFIYYIGSKIHNNAKNHTEQMVKLAVGYINQNYNKIVTLQLIADYLFLSPSYLSRIFKKYTGEGFSNYLLKIRLEHAHSLLLTGNYTVAQVSKKVGFDDPSYFSFVFKKAHNLTPIQIIHSSSDKKLST
ncbi:MAG: response regulator transcription factor [Bacillota bacterium]